MKMILTFLIISPILIWGCSFFNKSTDNYGNDVFFYLGSGFKNDTLEIDFDQEPFVVSAVSDFSIGIDISKYFQCSDGLIKLVEEGDVIDSS